jgi:hypothetical protein
MACVWRSDPSMPLQQGRDLAETEHDLFPQNRILRTGTAQSRCQCRVKAQEKGWATGVADLTQHYFVSGSTPSAGSVPPAVPPFNVGLPSGDVVAVDVTSGGPAGFFSLHPAVPQMNADAIKAVFTKITIRDIASLSMIILASHRAPGVLASRSYRQSLRM